MSIFSSFKENKRRSKIIMEDVMEIDRKKAEIVSELVPLIKDFYETWHTESVIERRMYKLFSDPQKNTTNKKIESEYSRDLEDLEREQEDLKKIKRLIQKLEEYDEELKKNLNLLKF